MAALAAFVTVLGVLAPTAAIALPDPAPGDISAVASLEKVSSAAQVAPGETFTYTITLGCSAITATGCQGAVMTDLVPAPFEVVDVSVGGGVNTAATPVVSGNSVTVTWTTPLGDGTIGLLDNSTGIVAITARLPEDVSYDVSGTTVVNNAVIEGTNFADVDDEAPVTPIVPLELATVATKSFEPASLIATDGAPVTAHLGGTNGSNATVESLVLQDPENPDASPNPFDYAAFVDFGTVAAPAGADPALTTYEVYVGGAWVPYTAAIDPEDVRGTRVTFVGDIPAGATASADLDLELTALAAAQDDGFEVDNDVTSTVVRDGADATDDADAALVLRQNTVTVGATKSFSPELVVAGEPSTVTLGASNDSVIPIESLTITEPASGSFPATYTFGGFTGPVAYPAGADTGTVMYHTADGDFPVPFADGTIPPLPAGVDAEDVTSFDMVFTGDEIEPGADTSVPFRVDTDPAAAPLPATVNNVVGVTGANAGVTDDAIDDADLYVYAEQIEPYIGKTIRPSEILGVPGEVVTVSLTGGLTERPSPPDTPTGTTGQSEQVILQDPLDPVEPNVWWNAFDVTAITQTPVPAGSTLTIEYWNTATDSWEVFAGPIAGPTIYSAPVPPDVQAAAGGIRFVYDDATGDGFPPGTDFAPNFTSEMRSDGRYTPGTTLFPATEYDIPDCAQSSASALNPAVPGGSAAMDPGAAAGTPGACPEITILPPDPGNADFIDKAFGTSSSGGIKSVIARSGDTIPSVLRWSTGGYSNIGRMEITDSATPEATAVADTVYDAFDLVRVEAITPATDPLIAFDQVQAVLLWNGADWVPAANSPCPAGCIGQLPAVNLTTAEQATTTGVKLIFVEAPAPYRAQASVGNLDAPAVGSGVARSFGNERPVTLTWRVRDETRSAGTPVLGDELYNLAQPGVVRNTVNATAFPSAAPPISADDQDDVIIIDVPITTATDKNWSGGPLAVTPDASVPANQYPLSRITVTTRNTTPAKADTLIITDPAPGSVLDRRTDPFQAFSLNNFSAITVPSGATSTIVTLFCPDGSSVDYTREGALALTAAALPCDVSGIQVAFDGRIASNAAGVLAFDVRLRPVWRGTNERITPADSPIINAAEGVVADVDPPAACPPPAGARYACDQAIANIALESPTFGISAAKTIAPAEQREDDFSPVTVTLTAQPTGSTRATTATMEDSDPTFWNAFDFVGMDPRWVFVAPLGRVQVCYLAGGSFTDATVGSADPWTTVGGTWTCSAVFQDIASASAYLAGVADRTAIHGLSFQFWQADDLGWQDPPNPRVPVPFLVERRAELRTGGPVPTTRSDQMTAPGERTAGVFQDTMTADSVSAQIAAGQNLTASASAPADYTHVHLEAALNVTKSPNGDVQPGVAIPYALRFTNTGEAPLIDPVFSDRIPTDGAGNEQLILDPDRDQSVAPWSFTLEGPAPAPPNGSALPTDADAVVVEKIDHTLYFRMPVGAVLEPGQTYTITIQLMLRPGVTPQDDVQNWAAVKVTIPLDACAPTFDPATGECIDDSIVSPLAVPALQTVKSVKADAAHTVAGVPQVLSAVNGFTCNGTADVDGFYRAPCVPVTVPGATETWRFAVTNAGTLPLDDVVTIDNLPTPGDQGLIVVLPRESEWQPTWIGDVTLVGAPATAVLATFYSTSSTPCTADLNPLGPPCLVGSWLPYDPATVPAASVRSVKFAVHFPDDDLFLPGESYSIQYQTMTTPTSFDASALPIAYNTVSTGGSALNGATAVRVPATEGRRVGVSYPTGPLQLQKIVSGEAMEFAPDSFPVTVECTSLGVPVTGIPAVVLIPGAAPTTIEGLPWGAQCTATEGQWGQTETIIGTATVGGPNDAVIGLVTVENVFDVAGLVIRKQVDAAGLDQRGNPIEYGPFAFSVVCAFDGDPRYADGYGPGVPMEAEISPGESWALGGLQVGTECTVTETDDVDAEATSWAVDGDPDAVIGADSVTLTIIDETTVDVLATNAFGAGSLVIEKAVEGDGEQDYGAGPFRFAVQCVLDTGGGLVQVWSGFITIDGEGTAEITDIAAGAECTVREIVDGGATDVDISPNPVDIESGEPVVVTVTNTFDVGALTVTKVVEGDGADAWGSGPFEVTLTCFTTLGQPVEIPGGAVQPLDESNGFTAVYDSLLVGILCGLQETDTGGATTSEITDGDGDPAGIFRVAAQEYEFTVTNTFDLGAFTVVKTVSGTDAAAHQTDVFRVSTTCTFNGAQIPVPDGADRALTVAQPVAYTGLPVGASCVVRETDAGSATAVTLSPVDPDAAGQALIVVGTDAAASVSLDNRFDPLPPTGVDGARVMGLGILASLVLGSGALLLIAGRRRRPS